MTMYRMIKTLPIGAGTIVQLDAQQAHARKHRLDPLGDGRYRVKEAMQFKVGEVLGLEDELPKVHEDCVEELASPEPAAKKEPAARAAKKEPAARAAKKADA